MRTFILATIVFSSLVGAAELAVPGWEITLGEFGELHRPGMALLIGEDGYFTNATGKRDCPGKNIYHFPIVSGRREPTELLKIDCVQALQTDGQNLLVTYRSVQGDVTAIAGKDGQLTALAPAKLTEAQRKAHEARLAWVLDYVDKPRPNGEPSVFAGVRTGLTRPAAGGVWFDLFGNDGRPLLAAPVFYESRSVSAQTVFASEDGRYLFSLEDDGEWSRLVSFPTTSAEKPDVVTRAEASEGGTQWPFAQWSVLNPQYYGGIPGGAFIYEGSRDARMQSGIYVVLPAEKVVKAVQIPSPKFLSGVSFTRGGFLVSRPSQRTIQWYGNARDAFKAHEIAVSDVRRNPGILDAGDVERQKE